VLLLKLRALNHGANGATAHIWIGMKPAEPLDFSDNLLTSEQGRSVRARLRLPGGAESRLETCKDEGVDTPALHITKRLGGGAEATAYLALPFIPVLSAPEIARLRELDYASERSRVIDYWHGVMAQGIPFHVPEARFNNFALGLLARIRISATKDPKSGIYMVPAASYNYPVFANEAAFQSQLLDVLGHHRLAQTYLQAWVELQGSKPLLGTFTGDQKEVYHGARVDGDYDYTAAPYNLNHGTVLWTLGEHYLITRDAAWLKRVAPGLKRAANWVIEQRRLTKVVADGEPCPEYGLLPAGHLEDNRDWGHWFSVNAFASLGITTLAEALEDIGDNDARKYRKEAELYRNDLRVAVARAVASSPVIRLRDNTWVPYVPTRVHQRIRLFGPLRVAFYSRYPEKALPTYRLSATRELLYGPLILVDTGVFDAAEPLAQWILDDWEDNATMSEPLGLNPHGWVDEEFWFSRGGMVFQANLQNPVYTYLRRGETRAAIRSLHNSFVACYYPTVGIFTEEFRQWRAPSGPFYKVPDEARFTQRLRDLLVQEYNNDLYLAGGIPERWLTPGNEITVNGAPTHFGSLSYSLRGSANEVHGAIELPTRNPYRNAWLTIRVPENKRIRAVTINGKSWTDIDRAHSSIRLPQAKSPLKVVVEISVSER
jgi:hypothetical protein